MVYSVQWTPLNKSIFIKMAKLMFLNGICSYSKFFAFSDIQGEDGILCSYNQIHVPVCSCLLCSYVDCNVPINRRKRFKVLFVQNDFVIEKLNRNL